MVTALSRRLWAAAFVLLRVALLFSTPPQVFDDSAGYAWDGRTTIRPYGISILFSLCQNPRAITIVQTLISIACWLWMMSLILRSMHATPRASAAVVGILGLASCTWPIAMWDRAVLSESLTFGLLALAVGAVLNLHTRKFDRRSMFTALAVLVAGALIREIALATFIFPLILGATLFAPSNRLKKFGTFACLGVALTWFSFIPANQRYLQDDITMTSFRNLVIIGCRILPDDDLRQRFDPTLVSPGGRICPALELGRYPAMRKYAHEFSFGRYLFVEASRPYEFLRYSAPSLDNRSLIELRWYGLASDPAILAPASAVLWSWSASVHVILTGALFALTALLARHRGQQGVLGPLLGLSGSCLAFGAAVLARLGGSLEAGRHAAPFLVASRIGLCVCMLMVLPAVAAMVRHWPIWAGMSRARSLET